MPNLKGMSKLEITAFKYIKNSQGRICKLLDYIPDGWVPIKNSWTAPKGYQWYSNGKSLFSGKCQTALIKMRLEESEKK